MNYIKSPDSGTLGTSELGMDLGGQGLNQWLDQHIIVKPDIPRFYIHLSQSITSIWLSQIVFKVQPLAIKFMGATPRK